MKRMPQIMVAFDMRLTKGREFLQGVADFAARHGPWDCDFTYIESLTTRFIRQAQAADGIIIRINLPRAAEVIARLKKPVVAVEMLPVKGIPRVSSDPEAIGRMAAEHMMERGFRRFAYCAFHGSQAAMERGNAFVHILESNGYACEWFKLHNQRNAAAWRPDHAQLLRWVRKLPKPIAVFTVGDTAAREVAMACRDEGIPVPGQVAILGVDNDEILCRFCSPQLSSIDIGSKNVGFEAAKLLKRMLGGHKKVTRSVLVPPIGVVVRESSDIVAVEAPHVATAVRYIQAHLSEGISVKQLVQHLPVSRRALELAFRSHLGRTIHQEIVLAKLHHATRLLLDGFLSLAEIAKQCGMGHRAHLNRLIKENTGLTPLEYRRRHHRKKI